MDKERQLNIRIDIVSRGIYKGVCCNPPDFEGKKFNREIISECFSKFKNHLCECHTTPDNYELYDFVRTEAAKNLTDLVVMAVKRAQEHVQLLKEFGMKPTIADKVLNYIYRWISGDFYWGIIEASDEITASERADFTELGLELMEDKIERGEMRGLYQQIKGNWCFMNEVTAKKMPPPPECVDIRT